MGETRTRPSAWQTSKNPQKVRSRKSYISVAVSGSQLIKLIKSVTSLVLKKMKSHCYSLRFLRKAPTTNRFACCFEATSKLVFCHLLVRYFACLSGLGAFIQRLLSVCRLKVTQICKSSYFGINKQTRFCQLLSKEFSIEHFRLRALTNLWNM